MWVSWCRKDHFTTKDTKNRPWAKNSCYIKRVCRWYEIAIYNV